MVLRLLTPASRFVLNQCTFVVRSHYQGACLPDVIGVSNRVKLLSAVDLHNVCTRCDWLAAMRTQARTLLAHLG